MTSEERKQVLELAQCGPSTTKCACKCPDGPCEHKWDGEGWESDDGLLGSSTCSRCGKRAIDHDQWVGP